MLFELVPVHPIKMQQVDMIHVLFWKASRHKKKNHIGHFSILNDSPSRGSRMDVNFFVCNLKDFKKQSYGGDVWRPVLSLEVIVFWNILCPASDTASCCEYFMMSSVFYWENRILRSRIMQACLLWGGLKPLIGALSTRSEGSLRLQCGMVGELRIMNPRRSKQRKITMNIATWF